MRKAHLLAMAANLLVGMTFVGPASAAFIDDHEHRDGTPSAGTWATMPVILSIMVGKCAMITDWKVLNNAVMMVKNPAAAAGEWDALQDQDIVTFKVLANTPVDVTCTSSGGDLPACMEAPNVTAATAPMYYELKRGTVAPSTTSVLFPPKSTTIPPIQVDAKNHDAWTLIWHWRGARLQSATIGGWDQLPAGTYSDTLTVTVAPIAP